MITKAIEIRDRATFVPAIAISTAPANEGQRYLLRRSGYAPDGHTIILVKLSEPSANYDVYQWDSRTMQIAHSWIEKHFSEIEDGAVVDVQHIIGETAEPKRSEREEWPS